MCRCPNSRRCIGASPPGKSRDRLQAAVLGWRGKMLEEIAGIVGRDSSTRPSVAAQDGERGGRMAGTTARAPAGRGA